MGELAATHRAPKVSFGAGFLLCLCLGQESLSPLGSTDMSRHLQLVVKKAFSEFERNILWPAESALCTDVSLEAVEVSLDLALLGPSCYLSAKGLRKEATKKLTDRRHIANAMKIG